MTQECLNVLVVEDHVDTLEYLKLYLEESGHHVQCARTVAQAVEMLPHCKCDVLVSDVGLPDGSGWDLLRQAHLERPIYAVVMSGFAMSADVKRSKAAGFRHHIAKPIDPDVLDAVLDEAAKERRGA